jgi:hypothetical protein
MELYDAGAGDTIMPAVALDDFFDGNWDEDSLAPNSVGYGRPALCECYRILKEIRDRDDVQDVLVAIHETPYADEPLDFEIWPDSDTVYILTSCSRDEVVEWTKPLKPDDIGNDWLCDAGKRPQGAPELRPGVKVHGLWWD